MSTAETKQRARFNPQEHLRQLRGRGGASDYLDVKWRLVWLRDEHPDATIETEKIAGGAESNYAEFRARVSIPGGGAATGHGSETKGDFGDFVEKAETKAIGRALAALGFGTQFVGDELDEGERIVDGGVQRPQRQQPQAPATTQQPAPTPLKVEEWSDDQLLQAMGKDRAEAQYQRLLVVYIGRASDRGMLLDRTRASLLAGPDAEAFKNLATEVATARGDELGLPRKAKEAAPVPFDITEVVGQPEQPKNARLVELVWSTAKQIGWDEARVRSVGERLCRNGEPAKWSAEQLNSFLQFLRSGNHDQVAG